MNVAQIMLSGGADAASAVLFRNQVVTHGELRSRVLQIAAGLLARGHSKGNRIGICSENNPFFVTAYLGIMNAGMVAVPLPAEFTSNSVKQMIRETEMRELLVSDRLFPRVESLAAEAGLRPLREGDTGRFPLSPPNGLPEVDPARDLAALMFTSGSTGTPKGVMLTHRNIESNARDIIAYLKLAAHDRVMAILPFHYCFGLSLLHTHLMVGGSIVLNNNFKLYPETVLSEMLEKECTGFAGVPSTYQILLRRSRFRQMPFPKLRWLQQAGGKLPNPCITEILSSFPEVRVYVMYGQTEGTARLSYLPPERLQDKLGSIGKGLASTRLEVLDAAGDPVKPGSSETGEIVATGDNIALGYWNDPDETGRFFKNGRLHTGDIARVDSDGFIYIVEREREMIKSGGNRVSAKEVEDVIAELPEIVEVAIIGVPHELLGEAIKAFVVPAPDAQVTPQAVLAHCAKRLPGYKVPETVEFLKAMPHNSSGKVLKLKLKDSLEGSR